jgi:hypothetical protein
MLFEPDICDLPAQGPVGFAGRAQALVLRRAGRIHWVRLPGSTALPVGLGSEMLVQARLPVAVGPAVVAKFWRVLELILGDVRDVHPWRAVPYLMALQGKG